MGGKFTSAFSKQFNYGINPESIHSPEYPGELIIMPSIPNHMLFFNKADLFEGGNTQPQVIIFTGRKIFIKETIFCKKIPVEHRSRRADQAQLK